MVVLIVGMLICVGLAVAVVGLVAVPARREGRELLTPQGEELVATVKERTESTLDRTGEALTSAKDKVADTIAEARTSSVSEADGVSEADDVPHDRAS
ncbi:hypothetical protein [Pedococcus sp.]|jgi:hypothetical protein|uniref:hypothetical protein n=1 Tax=Pedococcus sp. TaxID=2860345 RepID=UPI002E16288B|nr:hypothetical protein [Pedococcus sp.]